MVRFASCAGVSVATPSVTVTASPSAVRTAPSGIPLISTESVSLSSVSAEEMSRAMAVSSLPLAASAERVGASATPVTDTGNVAVVVAVSLPSVLVAVTVRSKSSLLFAGGVIVRFANCAGVSVATPSVTVTASPSAVRTAPSGIPLISTDRVSLSSVSAEEMSRAMAVSSLPLAASVERVGASATPVTDTGNVAVVVAVSLPSVLVAVTVRSKSSLLFAGGVIVRFANCAGVSVATPSVTVTASPSAIRTAPSGMPLISTDKVSLSSVSAEEMSRAMAVSSLPLAASAERVGASATPVTDTGNVAVVVAVSLPSVLVAVTVRSKSSLLFAGGVIVRFASCAGVSVATPSVTVTASPSAVRTAPSGMPLISTDKVSDPSVSVRAELISRAMAVSSLPLAADRVNVGASAPGVISTSRVSLVIARAPPSPSTAIA